MRTQWVHMSLGIFKAVQDHLHSGAHAGWARRQGAHQGLDADGGSAGGDGEARVDDERALARGNRCALAALLLGAAAGAALLAGAHLRVEGVDGEGPVVSSISLLCRQMGPVNTFNPVLPTVRVCCSTFSLSSEGRFTFSPKVPTAARIRFGVTVGRAPGWARQRWRRKPRGGGGEEAAAAVWRQDVKDVRSCEVALVLAVALV